MSGWSYQATWPAAPESVAMARQFVASRLRSRLLEGLVDEAGVVVSELATNAVRHAGTPFTVTLDGVDGLVRLRVRDGSSHVPVQAALAVALADNGRGLVLVDALSVTWGVTAEAGGGKSVWAMFSTAVR